MDSKKIGLKETTNSESPWSKTKKNAIKKLVCPHMAMLPYLNFFCTIDKKFSFCNLKQTFLNILKIIAKKKLF